MSILVTPATPDDVRAIAEVRTAAAAHLTTTFGGGHWSTRTSEAAVRDALRTPLVLVARIASLVVGTLRLQTRKPRTIDITYFTPVRRPHYVVDVAVHPDVQRQGIGRQLWRWRRRRRPVAGERHPPDTYDDWPGGRLYRACRYREVARVTHRDVPLLYYELLLPSPRGARPGAG
jgi:GNAT superfamily N-acetyltransferase